MIKFNINCQIQWFKGIITAYNGLTGKYGVYFPYDNQTEYMLEDDEDIRFVESQNDNVVTLIILSGYVHDFQVICMIM